MKGHCVCIFAQILFFDRLLFRIMAICFISGVARPGPTRACALPSTFQALPSPIS